MLDIYERQRRRNNEYVWVPWVQWSGGDWGEFADMGCSSSRSDAMSYVKKYITEHSMKWAMGNQTRFGFSRRIRFKKFRLAEKNT